ncbi:hypothetical protein DKX38_013274 [Salix brachista]|uniref:Myosin motor domain-containing protein n=1 Tax=Salix brachista TaxID=2182728 RepID=A0A5N5LRG7_9ROSI|nr:hypothetical protein DKX38_013274 [Salix brachista]
MYLVRNSEKLTMNDLPKVILEHVAAQVNSTVGSFVWVEDPEEAWMDGEIMEVNGEDVTVNCESRKMDIEKYKLANPRTFHYLNQSNFYDLDGVNESEEYLATRRAMDIVGINADEQDAIFRVVAAILHLGNVEFAKGNEIDSSEPKDMKSQFHLKTAAELLMCNEMSLENSLCKRVIVTRDESITKWLDPDAATVNRDALAKIVYSRLFDWIVNTINNSIGQDPNSKSLIGVLDIYGFESFKTNSFEQFCINLTNEKLQQHFNQHVFKAEQEEYTKEEIDWSYIEFIDNQDVLDLIEKKPGGIISLLDEACMFPRSTHETFAEKLYQTFKDHKRFNKPKLSRSDFTICHYAGDVTYQTEHFLDKNKDYVVAEHQALLSESKCSFVSGLFPPLPEETAKSSKFSSIGSRCKQQLQALLETLSATEPHYMRCVKPNNALKPSIFENNNVLQQLCCGGVMEAIRISCAGYPTRKTFDEFLRRFAILAPDVLHGGCDKVSACKMLLEKVNVKGYQIGKTKVFLRAGQMAELDAHRSEVLGRSASIIQMKFRSYFCRKSFILLRQSAIHIQTLCRAEVARNRFECLRRETACLKIQKYSRRYLASKAYNNLCFSAVSIQSCMRGMAARNELCFRKQMRAVIVIQASKETGALQAAKSKLEKEVEELTWRLQLEKRIRADLEESKTQENAKLRTALQEMQLEFQESKALLIEEREAIKKAAEQTPTIEKVPVIDNELVYKLTAENEMLKAMVSSLEKRIDETEKKYEETSKLSEERLKQALNAESKIIELKTAMQRLEEKLSDMEVEDQVLRHQALFSSSSRKMSEHLEITSQHLENGHHEPPTPSKRFGTDADKKMRKSQIERLHESVDALIKCVEQNPGFSQGKPVGAFTIYRCLVHWRSFEAEKTSVFDRLIQMIGSAIENQDDNYHLAYWLSNTSMLLFLLQRTLKGGGANSNPLPPTSFFGRMAQGFRSSPSSANLRVGKDIQMVEGKYPALLFKQQLTAYVETIYGIVRDNFKKDLSPLLSSCIQSFKLFSMNFICKSGNFPTTTISKTNNKIQAPRASKGTALKSSLSFGHSLPADSWRSIVNSLDGLLCTLKENFVPPIFVQKIFTQIFSYINVQLFNSLLLRRECCTFSNGEYVKAGLAELELWCGQAKEEYVGVSWDELKHTRQAVGFLVAWDIFRCSTFLATMASTLVIHQKSRISYDEISNDLCPVLSVQQLYRVCTLYWDDDYNTQSVSSDVISSMKTLANDSNDDYRNSFLMDDISSIPFSVDDLSGSFHEKDFSDVKPAADLLENPAFQFLQD